MRDPFERTVDLVTSEGKDVLARALRRGGSIAGLFAEESAVSSASLRVRRSRPVNDRKTRRHAGAGIHLFDAAGSAYASTDDLSTEGLRASAEQAAEAFRSSARDGSNDRGRPGSRTGHNSVETGQSDDQVDHISVGLTQPVGHAGHYSAEPGQPDDQAGHVAEEQGRLETYADVPPDTLGRATDAEVGALLHSAADAALSLLPNLDSLHVALQERSTRFIAASSDGRFVRSSHSTLSLRVFLRGRDGVEVHAVGGGAGGLGLFLRHRPEDVAREAAERLKAVAAARATPRLSGEHAVVIAGGWGGVWLHEVIGHALEADVGAFSPDRLGDRVGGDIVTVVDDANLAGGRGGAPVDDEGSPGQRTVLIEQGVLRGLLTDRASALRLGIPETGNGRRHDYRYPPLPRMSNLALAPGEAVPEDLLPEAALYVKMIGGGRVFPSKDTFSFDVAEGYVIENGRLGRAVTGLRLHGRPSEMLRSVVAVGNDFRLDPGRGTCEKKGQVVPVSVGMPTILVDRMTIAAQE